jgi:hypothetical protein
LQPEIRPGKLHLFGAAIAWDKETAAKKKRNETTILEKILK